MVSAFPVWGVGDGGLLLGVGGSPKLSTCSPKG